MNSDPALSVQSPKSSRPATPKQIFGLSFLEFTIMAFTSAAILLASWLKAWPIELTEAFGFVTGGICVWLVVREHMWNWPLGLLNNVFFFILFFKGRLFADMGLQVVYLVLGIYGWWNWLFGGAQRSVLKISGTTRIEWLLLLPAIPLATWALRELLLAVNGAAPFWDALTTILSLVAQYLLCKKRLENWAFWIAADLIYVPLYVSRQLPLTAALYAVFLAMCFTGIYEWKKSMANAK